MVDEQPQESDDAPRRSHLVWDEEATGGADGAPGHFRRRLYVYERAGKPCRRCRTPIRRRVQGQRATYWCPQCQA